MLYAEVMNMNKKDVTRCLSAVRALIFGGKWGATLLLMASLLFFAASQWGGPLGSLECAEVLLESALVTTGFSVGTEYLFHRIKRMSDSIS